MTGDRRVIGPLGAVTVVTGTMLGIGIFLTPPIAIAAVPDPASFYALWLLGGAVAFCGATIYAELATMMPEAGGDVVFLREGLGRSVAAASGAVMYALIFSGSIAALCAAICQYQLQALLGPAADLSQARLGIPLYQWAGIGMVWLFTGLNVLSVRMSAGAQALFNGVPFAILTAIAVAGLLRPGGEVAAVAAPTGIVEAWLAIYFAYSGWDAVVYVAGEVRNPSRNLPLGLVGGTVLVTALYLLLCAAFLHVLGPGGLAAAGEAGSALAAALFGPQGGVFAAALIGMGLLATINGTVLGGSRVAEALADQGDLPAALGRRTGRAQAPRAALAVQGLLASLLLLTGGFETIVQVTSLNMMLIGSLTVLAAVALRWRRPDAPRPHRALLWPLTPLLYLLANGVIGVMALAQDAKSGNLGRTLLGIGLLAVATVYYALRPAPRS